MRMETFGFSFAEDGAAFVPDEILGKNTRKDTVLAYVSIEDGGLCCIR